MTSRPGARPFLRSGGGGQVPGGDHCAAHFGSGNFLDLIRHPDSAQQIRRTARLVGDLAAITSTLAMCCADLLFCTMSGDSSERLQRRFIVPLQAVVILNNVCAHPLVLRD
jgi:hypothetical protein